LLPFGTLILLSLVERLFPPAGPRKSLKQWFLHLQINIFWSLAAGLLFVLAIMAASALAHFAGFQPGFIDLRFAEGKGLPVVLAAVWVSAIVGDFFFYWYHRTLHKVHLLWQIHKMHHMDQELDALTVFRDNWLDTVGSAIFTALPMALLFKLDILDPWQLGLLGGASATALSTLLTLGHMNVRLQVGRASLLFCSPQVHRIHHSCLPQHFDKNFSVVFPLWDVLFGTYYSPVRNEFPPTGVPNEKEIQSFWEAQTFTLREWWKMLRRGASG
jgi:sterol desaturase/sphingolipid hydroxylase (fatty acid hydroxylase superfamily)